MISTIPARGVSAPNTGFTHAVTMDTDGQLDPEQIPELLRLAQRSPQALVLSFRDETKDDYPAKSRMGRSILPSCTAS